MTKRENGKIQAILRAILNKAKKSRIRNTNIIYYKIRNKSRIKWFRSVTWMTEERISKNATYKNGGKMTKNQMERLN